MDNQANLCWWGFQISQATKYSKKIPFANVQKGLNVNCLAILSCLSGSCTWLMFSSCSCKEVVMKDIHVTFAPLRVLVTWTNTFLLFLLFSFMCILQVPVCVENLGSWLTVRDLELVFPMRLETWWPTPASLSTMVGETSPVWRMVPGQINQHVQVRQPPLWLCCISPLTSFNYHKFSFSQCTILCPVYSCAQSCTLLEPPAFTGTLFWCFWTHFCLTFSSKHNWVLYACTPSAPFNTEEMLVPPVETKCVCVRVWMWAGCVRVCICACVRLRTKVHVRVDCAWACNRHT